MLVNVLPTGQKYLHQKLDTKKEPMSAMGRIYHCTPIPSRENIMAKGSYAPKAGCEDRKIVIRENHRKKLTMNLLRFCIVDNDISNGVDDLSKISGIFICEELLVSDVSRFCSDTELY